MLTDSHFTWSSKSAQVGQRWSCLSFTERQRHQAPCIVNSVGGSAVSLSVSHFSITVTQSMQPCRFYPFMYSFNESSHSFLFSWTMKKSPDFKIVNGNIFFRNYQHLLQLIWLISLRVSEAEMKIKETMNESYLGIMRLSLNKH